MCAQQVVHRKRLQRFEIEHQPRFLTFSCYQRLALFSNDAIKDAFALHLQWTRERTHFRILAWVLMPEHVHLIIVPSLPAFPLPEVLRHLKGGFANNVLHRWRKLNAPILARLADARGKTHFWQSGGGYDRNIRDEAELFEKIEYIHDNPRRRKLVELGVDWVWSSGAARGRNRDP